MHPQGMQGRAQGFQGVQGPQGIQGIQGIQGFPGPSSVAACPAGYTKVELPRSTLCIRRENFVGTWSAALDRCTDIFSGGGLCTYQQLRRSCTHGGLGPIGGGANTSWLGDRSGDDGAVSTNGNDCANFDGTSNTLNNLNFMYCCLEFMKY